MGIFSKSMFLFLILAVSVYAEDIVVVNSVDGRDTLSGIFYANVKGLPVKFMPVPGGTVDVLAAKVGSGRSVLLIQSKDMPASTFVEAALRKNNNTIDSFVSQDGGATNLELAKRSGAQSFILVDPSFSDSALSVLPYASMSKSYVIFVEKDNLADVKKIVSGKKLMTYGFIDSQVKSEISSMKPEVIGDGSDKFIDNILIAKKTMAEYKITRAYIVDGTFIEEGMAVGDLPILLTGRIVPQATYDFVKQSVRDGKLKGLMLAGSGLTFTMYDMRDKVLKELKADGSTETFGVTVRFAQAVPGASGGVINLDTFRLPAYKPVLNISEIAYNKQDKKVAISVQNLGDGPAYFTIEVRIKSDGQEIKVLGDSQAKVVEAGETLGVEYALDLSSVEEGAVTADALVRFGSSKTSTEDYLSASGPLATITFADATEVSVQGAKYDTEKKSVLVTIRNSGKDPAYVSSKVELTIDGTRSNVSSSKTEMIEASSILVQEFPVTLSDADLSSGKNGTVYVSYGGKLGFLRKSAVYSFGIAAAGKDQTILIVIAVVILAVAAILFFMLRKSGKKAP
jgi:hypothetical protein